MFDLFIFDFDGVVADTELAANTALANGLSGLGRPTSLEDSLARYMGRRWVDCLAVITEELGEAPPEGFKASCDAEMRRLLEVELNPVPGVAAFIDRFPDVPRCIASSSSPAWLVKNLDRMGLADRFGERLFSAQRVTHGKPAPDLFLLAAREMGNEPSRALVIEDSVPGVTAGRAAGMTTVGLLAGSHIRDGHGERLSHAGADRTFASYAALGDWLDAGASPAAAEAA